jgi:hypothetical protein
MTAQTPANKIVELFKKDWERFKASLRNEAEITKFDDETKARAWSMAKAEISRFVYHEGKK